MFRNALFAILLCVTGFGAIAQQTDMSVATIERKPFAFKDSDGWTGFSIELWELIGAELGYTTTFVEKTKFSDMLGSVERNDVDAAAANISITHSREQVMDFSQTIFDSGLLVLMPKDSGPSIFSVLFRPSLLGWLAGAFGLLIAAGGIIAFLERNNPHFQTKNAIGGIEEGIWWAVNVVTNASFTIFTPMSRAGRFVAYGLIIVGLFVMSAFVAHITSALTVGELRSQVEGYRDLYDKKVGTTAGSTSANFLTRQSIPFTGYDSVDAMMAALKDGKLQAVVHDAPILAYFAATEGQGEFRTLGQVFNPEKYGFVFPQNSPHREAVNQQLLRIRETGEYRELLTKWFGNTY